MSHLTPEAAEFLKKAIKSGKVYTTPIGSIGQLFSQSIK